MTVEGRGNRQGGEIFLAALAHLSEACDPRTRRAILEDTPLPDDATIIANLQALSGLAAFNAWLGIEITAAKWGEVEIQLKWRPEFGQYNGYLHASIVGGLIDTACGFAGTTVTKNLLASQFSIRCLRPAVAEVFVAKGRVVKPGSRQIFTSAELYGLGVPDKPFAVGDAILVPMD